MTPPGDRSQVPDVAAAMEGVAWEQTAVGPPESWPPSLRSAVQVVLSSRFSMWMGWGPDLTFFYNDAYSRDTLDTKHPWALGRPAREVWAEIWDDIEPRIDTVLSTSQATWDEGLLLFLERSGYREETYHTFSYSPLADESGATVGMLCVVVEETERVLGERRLATLSAVSAALARTSDEASLAAALERELPGNAPDLPFTLTYLFEDDGARLAAATGVERGGPLAPLRLDAEAADRLWGVGGIGAGDPVHSIDLRDRDGVPRCEWGVPPADAVVLPLAESGQERASGFLVVGRNPFRELDDPYRGFLELLAGQIAAGLDNVRAREAERRRAAALAELDRAKTAFFQNVSHELRTPLSLILGPAEDALREAAGADRDRLDKVVRNGLRLQKMVDSLLDFSRVESGAVDPLLEPTDLAEFTTDLVSMFRSATDRAGLALDVRCDPAPLPAMVDRQMWERIVLNLVSNAFKFTLEGGIAVELRQEGGQVHLRVADTGTGIPQEELGRLFERFRRVRGAQARTHEGSGIGLALVQELVRLHEGTVDVESEVGRGTTFTVCLPVGEAAETLEAAAPTRAAASYAEEALRWLPESELEPMEMEVAGAGGVRRDAHVLVAEDNADLRDYLRRLLAAYCSVEVARNGREALEAVAARRPDLIVSDVMMPELDGFGLLNALRADPATAQTPVILLSARAGEEAAVAGLAAGADDYLVKPFSSRELLARVRATLDLSELRLAAAQATERHAQLLRDLADAAVAINRAATVAEVLEVTAQRARAIVGAEWALAALADGTEQVAGVDELRPGARATARRVPLAGREPLGELLLPADAGAGGMEIAAVLTQLAEVASIRLENAALYEREHMVAETLQRSLLPRTLPELEGAELAAVYLPGADEASVGGDWYDAFTVAGGELALIMGDVVGRGVRAASTMGQLRNAVRAYMNEGYGPADTLVRVNRLVHALGGGFATVCVARVDLGTGAVRYASAGHPPALVATADGTTHWLDRAAAPPVGAVTDTQYVEADGHLPPGGALVLYTDGLVERRDEVIDEGLERLATAAADGPGHAGTLVRRLVRAMPSTGRPDDVAVLALARHASGAEPLRLRLPAEPTSLAAVRRRLRAWTAAAGMAGEHASDLLLAVGEATSNAVEHPHSPSPAAIVVTAAVDGVDAVVTVRDHGGWNDSPSAPHRGHGLGILQATTDLVDIERSESGTTVEIRRRLR